MTNALFDLTSRVVLTNPGAKREPMRGADGEPLSLQHMGVASDIAPVVAFLACDASAFITGAQLVADGGYSIF